MIALFIPNRHLFSGYTEPDVDGRINFRQFVRVLAHFRPMSKSKPNTVNSREEKLKCKRQCIVYGPSPSL